MNQPENTNILIVDDHKENLTALEAILEDLGQNVFSATSAKEALKCLMREQDEFAVILLDIQMPEIDGFETANLIRRREKTRSTPIIFLSAISQNDFQIAQGYPSGAADYLFKPFDPAILKAKVAMFVELARKTKALQREIARRHTAEQEIRKLNTALEERVRERTAHIEMLNQRLKRMISDTHDRVRNNLQMLSAMLDMQVMEDTLTIPMKEVCRLRTHVRTLSLVHDLLTEQTKVDATSYALSVPDLLYKVIALLERNTERPKLVFTIEEAQLPVRESTSLALITSELSENAFTHGRGAVEVTFKVREHVASLEICDDGPGFDIDFDPKNEAHTGLLFVDNLTRHDLGGQVRYENRPDGGARVAVTLPYHGD